MNKLTIQELAENYGTYDLLIAYIMRTANINEEKAKVIVYKLDIYLERWIDELFEENKEYQMEVK